MGVTYFENFTRDNGLPVTVEYSFRGGEPNFDHPGHICDGGGSGPDVEIVDSWPNNPSFDRLCNVRNDLDSGPRPAWKRPFAKVALQFANLAVWFLALPGRLTDAERERMIDWICAHHVFEDVYEPEDYY